MIRKLLFSAILLVPALHAYAQPAKPSAAKTSPASTALTAQLPVDASVKIGTLANGLRYYIRRNSRPEKRAELRLVVNAGSVLENENQLGLAHFNEHTAFNGTTHFAKNDLVKYLQSIGVRFGADLNAETGFDETIYILPIPTDTTRIIEQAFTILEDWAHGQVFDSTEVTNERGVVREEWRLGRGADDRMLHQWLPIILKGSLYADRLPIGNEASIMTATPARLRSFYDSWYRPDLQAVIAVGDFDPAVIEAQIKKHFASIPVPVNAPKRPVPGIPDNQAPLIAIATDDEATSSSVQLMYKLPVEKTKTVADYRRDLLERMYTSMLNSRLSEIAQKPNAPFLGAEASKGSFVVGRTVDAFTLGAEVKGGGIEAGLAALLAEAKRVDEFGFLKSELDRQKANMLRGYERAYAERDKTNSAAFVEEYVGNFLHGEAIPGIAYEYKLAQQLIPTITLADVNRLASNWIKDDNRVILAGAPRKAGEKVPSREDILKVFDAAAKTPVVAYTEKLDDGALVAHAPVAGKVVSSKLVPGANITLWSLSNGVRVFVKPTDFKADEVLFSAQSPGGTSLSSDADYMSASLASQIVAISGLGNYNAIDLGKKLTGKSASAGAAISANSEGLSGRASPKDLETMFQLIYLDFTAPRLDSSAYQAFRNQVGPFLANRSVDPDQVFADTVQWTMAQGNVRARPLSPETFAEVDAQKALAFYKQRFADASDFTFVFVGNVDTLRLKPLVEKYIASLPVLNRKETFRDNGGSPPKGVINKIVHKGVEPKANSLIEFTGSCQYNVANRMLMRAMIEVLQIKLDETLREQLGGVYSPSAGGACVREPTQHYTVQVQFNSSPDNVDKLSSTLFAIIDTLTKNGPSQTDLDHVKEELARAHEVDIKQNGFWTSNVLGRDAAGEDIAGLGEDYNVALRKISAAQVQAAFAKYFDVNNYARFVLLPVNPKPVP